MGYLIATTLMWAFSFSFIGEFLAGEVDSYFAVLVRVGLASLVFLPFTKFRGIPRGLQGKIMGIGAVQVGVMYLFFYHSFAYLRVPEVVLFTIFTPFYVTLIYDAMGRRFRPLYLVSAGVAVLGAYIIRFHHVDTGFLVGFLLVQGANVCFALGQSAYKKVMESHTTFNQRDGFGYFHLGALGVVSVAFVLFGDTTRISPTLTQWAVLLWLGMVASGAGYFWWNKGACHVDAGVLAIMNNALVPAGLLVNLFLWGKPANFSTLIIGSIVIGCSLWLHHYFMRTYSQTP
ncbi:MAG: DMT family transporter [Campylobacterales bacterium]|nr:DMT family transporter [Campylobacterales bacterium]